MRVFVSFGEAIHRLDIDIGQTVGDIKNSLKERFGLNLKNHRNETDQFVSLVYQGSSLHDDWVYSDLGISPGSTLVCRVEKQVEATLTVQCINNNDMIEYKNRFDFSHATVASLRGMIQDTTGVHVSAFRLYSNSGIELFDCHSLKMYGVESGDVVTMEIWQDVAEIVQTARDNDITDTLGSLASFHDGPHLMRYQLQLGLFIAAHYGYHQLATQLMKCGARPDEPVGLHPSRDWCRASAHADHVKTPAHEAAQHGQLKCLQHFLMFNYAVLVCKDAHGLTPSNIARRYKQTECFKLLVAEQFRIPSVHPELSVHVYSRVRKWCDRARLRARLHKDKTAMLLLTNAEVAQKTAVVGQKVEVDGYNPLRIGDRKVRSAPSSISTKREGNSACQKFYSSSTLGNVQSNPSLYNSVSRGSEGNSPFSKQRAKANPRLPNSKGVCFTSIQRTKSDILPKILNFNANNKLHRDKFVCENSKIPDNKYPRPNTTETYSKISLRATTNSKTLASGTLHASSRDSTFVEHKSSRICKTQQPNLRYVWKSVDEVAVEDQEKHGIPQDRQGHAKSSGHDVHQDSLKSTDVPSTKTYRKAVGSCQKLNENTMKSPDKTGEKTIYQDERWTVSRGKIGTGCDDVTQTSMNRSSVTSEALKKFTPSKSGSIPEQLNHGNSPVKPSSVETKDLMYGNINMESNADKCLRVACEAYRNKSWLGQLQMALVVNTNMYKRR